MWSNPQETADLVTFSEEIFNGQLPFCAQCNWVIYEKRGETTKRIEKICYFVKLFLIGSIYKAYAPDMLLKASGQALIYNYLRDTGQL